MRCLELLEHSSHKFSLLLLSLLFLFYDGFGVSIKLKQFSKVQTDKIYLKDIAHIQTKNLDFKQFLGNILIDRAPPPQKTKVITRSKVISTLKAYHLDLSSIVVVGEKTIVLSDLKKISKNQIKQDILKFLKENLKNIKVQSISFRSGNYYAPSGYDTHINIRSKTGTYIYLDYIISYNEKEIKIPVSVKYSSIRKIVIASREIPVGHKITEEDIKTVEMSNVRDDLIENIDQVVGKIAKKRIQEGTPIKKYYLKPDFVVKKNDRVKVIYDSGVIRVELSGIALENGEKGQVIKVKNLSSGKKIKCRVLDNKTVLFIRN